ncbi:MAG TPA: metallophosphoesterase family protein [Solirubrobacteraceae bacterium]|nr:metallophosphoesterase family protein [Solirubrobacteraceae bacterium]
MRVAVLADIHGNLPALRAVLHELDRDEFDAIVIAGDVVGGPLVRETLESLAARREPTRWIRGNCEREAVAVFDGAPVSDGPAGRAAAWSAQALDGRWRDELAAWPVSLGLDDVCFCHGSPRRDDEIITRATPDAVLLEVLSDVAAPLIVGGHTHQQMIRNVGGIVTYANAGSVGMPYEGRPGAFWMVIDDGVPELRETGYDLEAAVEELRASGFPDVEEQLAESLLNPADPEDVTAFFERGARRS